MGKHTKERPLALPRCSAWTWRIPAGHRRPLTRRELHRKVHESVLDAVLAACLWEERPAKPLGDYRSVVFNASFVRGGGASLQLWSFPHHPVLIEVTWAVEHSTPRWPPADVAGRLRLLGFERSGERNSYHREASVTSMRDAGRTARLVVDTRYEAFDYRGAKPIEVDAIYDGRASEAYVYDSFSAEEIAWIAARLGYRTRLGPAEPDGSKRTIALGKGATLAEVVLADPTEPDQYASGFLGSRGVPASARRGARKALRRDRPGVKPDAWRLGVTMYFGGGVTAEWVAGRIEHGMALVAGRTPRPAPLLDLSVAHRPPRRLPHIYTIEELVATTPWRLSDVRRAIRRRQRLLAES